MPTTQRSALEEPKALTDMSASRISLASKCGLAFRYNYIDQIPEPTEAAAALFGSAIHGGVEEWYGPDDKPNPHQENDLAPIVCAQWERLLPPNIWKLVQELVGKAEETSAVAAAIKFKRPDLKSPEMTVEYKKAEAVVEFQEKHAQLVQISDQLNSIRWPKDEDPYKAYVKAAEIAAGIQKRWQRFPRPIAVERPFRIEVGGVSLRGRIDMVRADPDKDGFVDPAMRDLKTGRNPLSQMEAFIQSWIYYKAILADPTLPDTTNIGFALARRVHQPTWIQAGNIDPGRHDRLASRIIQGRLRQIAMGQFEPNYGFWCTRCDYQDLCSSEISMWKGDGFQLEQV